MMHPDDLSARATLVLTNVVPASAAQQLWNYDCCKNSAHLDVQLAIDQTNCAAAFEKQFVQPACAHVFYLEKADFGTPYSVNPFLSSQSYTPWLDCQNVNVNSNNIYNFSDGQSFTAGGPLGTPQPGTNNGCQPSGTSSGGGVRSINRFASGFITRYVAFGIRQGIKLKSVTFS